MPATLNLDELGLEEVTDAPPDLAALGLEEVTDAKPDDFLASLGLEEITPTEDVFATLDAQNRSSAFPLAAGTPLETTQTRTDYPSDEELQAQIDQIPTLNIQGQGAEDLSKRAGAGLAQSSGQAVAGVAKLAQGPIGQSLGTGMRILNQTGAFKAVEEFSRDVAEGATGDYNVNPEFDQSVASQIVSGATSIPIALASGPAAPVAIAGMMGEQQRKEAEDAVANARQVAAETTDPDERAAIEEKISGISENKAFYSGAAVGALSEALLGIPALLRSAKAAAIPFPALKEFARSVAGQAVKSAVREGTQEAIEQVAQNFIASTVAGYDPTRGTFKGAGKAFLFGAMIGAPTGAVIQSAQNYDSKELPREIVSQASTEALETAIKDPEFAKQSPYSTSYIREELDKREAAGRVAEPVREAAIAAAPIAPATANAAQQAANEITAEAATTDIGIAAEQTGPKLPTMDEIAAKREELKKEENAPEAPAQPAPEPASPAEGNVPAGTSEVSAPLQQPESRQETAPEELGFPTYEAWSAERTAQGKSTNRAVYDALAKDKTSALAASTEALSTEESAVPVAELPAETSLPDELKSTEERIANTIRMGKPLGYSTRGDGTVTAGYGLSGDQQVVLTLTKAEKKEFAAATADDELAETVAEKDAARQRIQDVLRPATERAISAVRQSASSAKTEQIPPLTTTQEAHTLGRTATPEQLTTLQAERDRLYAEAEPLLKQADEAPDQAASDALLARYNDLTTKAQLYREAIEEAGIQNTAETNETEYQGMGTSMMLAFKDLQGNGNFSIKRSEWSPQKFAEKLAEVRARKIEPETKGQDATEADVDAAIALALGTQPAVQIEQQPAAPTEEEPVSEAALKGLIRKPLPERLEYAEITNDQLDLEDKQVVEISKVTDHIADRVARELRLVESDGRPDRNSIFWSAAKDEAEIRARRFVRDEGYDTFLSNEEGGFNEGRVTGTIIAEITRTRDWREQKNRIETDAPLEDGGDRLETLLLDGRIAQGAPSFTPEQKRIMAEVDKQAEVEKERFLRLAKDREFLTTLTPAEKQTLAAYATTNPALKEAKTDVLKKLLDESDLTHGEVESSLFQKATQYDQAQTNPAPARPAKGRERPAAGVPQAAQASEEKEVAPSVPERQGGDRPAQETPQEAAPTTSGMKRGSGEAGAILSPAEMVQAIKEAPEKIKDALTRDEFTLPGQETDPLLASFASKIKGRKPSRIANFIDNLYNAPAIAKQKTREFTQGSIDAYHAFELLDRDYFQLAADENDASIPQEIRDKIRKLRKGTSSRSLPGEISSAKMAHIAAQAGALADFSMRNGVLEWHQGSLRIKEGSKGLHQTFKELIKKRGAEGLREWASLHAARRAKQLMAQGREALFTEEEADHVIAKYGNDPDFQQTSNEYNAFRRGVLEFSVRSHLIPKGLADKLMEDDNYLPFYRIMEDATTKGPVTAGTLAEQQSGMKKLKGGTANLGDPFENIERNLGHLLAASLRNVTMIRADEFAKTLRENGGKNWMEPVSPGAVANVSNEQVIADLKKQGVEEDVIETLQETLDEETIRQLWSIGNRPRGPDIIGFRKEGKQVYRKALDPMLLEAATATRTPVALNIFGLDVLAATRTMRRIKTAGVTMDPAFSAANLLRDNLAGWLINPEITFPFEPVVRGVHAMLSTEGRKNLALMAANGALNATQHQREVRSSISDLAVRKGITKKVLLTMRDALDMVTDTMSKAESVSRAGIANKAMQAGVSPMEAAHRYKDSTTDFSLKGGWAPIRFLAENVPFFNPALQSIYRTGRGVRENKKNFAIKAAMMTAASLAIALRNKDDPDYEALPSYVKDSYWVYLTGKPGDPDRHAYFLPKPFELGVLFGVIPERMTSIFIDKLRGSTNPKDTDEGTKQILSNILHLMRLSFEPVPMQEIREQWANKDSFTDRQIVPDHLEFLPPEAQKYPSTGQAEQKIGGALEVSPLRVRHAVAGFLGSMGKYVLDSTSSLYRMGGEDQAPELDFTERPVVKRFLRTSDTIQKKWVPEFYENSKMVDGLVKTIKLYEDAAQVEKALGIKNEAPQLRNIKRSFDRTKKQLTDLNDRMEKVQNSTDLTPREKKTQLRDLNNLKNETAQRGVELGKRAYPEIKAAMKKAGE